VGAEPDGLLAGALERTVAAGTARLTLTRRYDLTTSVPVLRRQGGIVSSAVRRAAGGTTITVRVDHGAIDFAGARCAVAGERRSTIVVGDSEWTGRPGRRIETGAEHPARAAQPLWLFDLCRGVVAVEPAERADGAEAGGEALRGHAARADLARVSAAVPYEVAVPYPVAHVEELIGFPFVVWTDDAGRIRRIRGVASPSGLAMTLDLHDFGVALPASYWTTFPVA
jgi:hypothetical protein